MKWTQAALLGGAAALTLYAVTEAIAPPSGVRENETDVATFPEVTGSNLEGRKYALPRDFEGEINLCLIAFTQDQQADVNTWLEGVKPLECTPGFRVYELPIIATSTAPFRLWLDAAMHRGIADRKQREQTITLYLDKEKFRRSLNLPNENSVYAVLADRAGRVLWQESGPYRAEFECDLKCVLEFARGA